MVMLRLTAEQYRTLPILASESICKGKVYIVTGSNTGLGLETVKHLVKFNAERVIIAVRNLESGEKSKKEAEQAARKWNVCSVWHLDMASTESVKSFVQKASTELDRIDGVVANAGIMIDQWSQTEGMETSMTVNVINTLFLGTLLIPKLSEVARKHSIHPTIVFIVSVLGYTAKGEMDKSRTGGIFTGLNDQKRADMDQRYPLTKLVEECAVRQLATLAPVERTGVIINMVAPGLCSTGLGKEARTFTRIMHSSIKAMMARTPEVGSRTILHGLVAGDESHGKLLSGCKIKEYWVPDWLSNAEGQRLQKGIWEELAAKLEDRQAGVVAQVSQA